MVSVEQVLALHDQLLLDRHEHEQVLGADLDAVVARGAQVRVDHWQSVAAHVDRVEVARDLAVREAQAAPGAALATARDRRGTAARGAPLGSHPLIKWRSILRCI